MGKVKRVGDSRAGLSRVVLLLWRIFEPRVAWSRIQIAQGSVRIFGAVMAH